LARRSLLLKILAGFAAVVVLGGGLLTYQVTHRGPPKFRRGGEFGLGITTTTATSTGSSETTASTAAAPAPAPAVTVTSGPAASSSTTASTRNATQGTTATTKAPAPTPTTAKTGTPTPTTPTTGAAPQPAGPPLPALGTYTYVVDGTEGASFVGTRRFPDRMTMVAHQAAGLSASQVVFDLKYSDQHAEREIVDFRGDGVYFNFEGGSVTFGPRTETSEADYEPPMLQIPKPLQAGFTRDLVVQAKNSSGSVTRTEDVKVSVLGKETLTIAGASLETWKVQVNRKIRPGSSDQGTRTRTYWFDPARNLWVKYTEVFHGERSVAVGSFTYDSNLTATLADFKAG